MTLTSLYYFLYVRILPRCEAWPLLYTRQHADNPHATSERSASLEQLKVFSRDVRGAEPLYTKDVCPYALPPPFVADARIQAIETLSRHSFDNSSLATSREALRCLANIFLLRPPTRQIFVNGGFASKAAERLKVHRTAGVLTVSSRVDVGTG